MEISTEWTFQKEFCTGGIRRNSYAKFLFISCFLITDSILGVEMLKVIVRGKFSPGLNCSDDISMGMGFSRQISWRYLKNDQKSN